MKIKHNSTSKQSLDNDDFFDEDEIKEDDPKQSENLGNNEDLDGLDDDEDLTFDDDNASPPMEKHKDLLLKLTDFSPYLKSQIMEWLGRYWDDEEKKYIRDENIEPMMNMQGARWGINFLRTYTRDNNIITNFEYKEFKSMMKSIIKIAYYVPAVKAEEFGLKNNSDIITFSNQLVHSVELVLLGAGGNQAYTKLLQTAVTRHENVNVTEGSTSDKTRGMRSKKDFFDGIKEYFGGR